MSYYLWYVFSKWWLFLVILERSWGVKNKGVSRVMPKHPDFGAGERERPVFSIKDVKGTGRERRHAEFCLG